MSHVEFAESKSKGSLHRNVGVLLFVYTFEVVVEWDFSCTPSVDFLNIGLILNGGYVGLL